MRNPRMRVATAALCTVAAAAGLTACGGGSNPPSDFCKDIAGVSSNVDQLTSTPNTKAGLPEFKTQVSQLSSDMKNLSRDAGDQFKPQVDAVEKAAVTLQSSVTAAIANPSLPAYRTLQSSVASFSAAVNDLTKATSSSC